MAEVLNCYTSLR